MSRSDLPPVGAFAGLRPRVERTPKNSWVTVLFLEDLQGMLGHFLKRSFLPCRGDRDCPTKRHEQRLDWRGYAAAFWRPPNAAGELWTPCIFEVTSQTAATIPDETIRGKAFYFGRSTDPRANGLIEVKPSNLAEGVAVPRPFPLRPILDRVFGESDYRLGVPNPIESIPVVEPFALEMDAPPPVAGGKPADNPAPAGTWQKLRQEMEERNE